MAADLSKINEPNSIDETDLSIQEANIFGSEQTHQHWIFIMILWVFAISIVLIFSIRVLHIILPESCHWLTDDQIGEIDRLSVSGVFGSLATLVFKRFGPKA